MKYYYRFIIVLGVLCSLPLQGQENRYEVQIFDDVEISSNIPYGANFSVLAVPVIGTTFKQPLVMDVYQPAGDTAKVRPLVIVLHTGNFLPIQINQGVTGEKTDSAVVEVCTRLAKMGYVAAAATYRLGWNPAAMTQPERALGLINAAYRGVQDARTCVRYFKRDFTESGNNFRIDTNRIVMWGQGTGGYIALATATLDQYVKIPVTEMPAGKFLTDLNGDGNPDPMVIEPINGDINGATIVGLSPGGPIPAGDTLALPNHTGYSSKYKLTVNMGGALGDISWLDQNSTPIISFHVVNDQFAPYQSDILVVPTTGDPIVEVQGSRTTIEKANALGRNDAFIEANITDDWTEGAKKASVKAGHEYQEGLYPFVIPLNMFGRADGSPWNWWSVEKWDTIVHPLAGVGQIPPGASFHFVSSLSDLNMSPEKGRTYIDTIMGYFTPRAYEVLELRQLTTSAPILDKNQFSLQISPNPTPGFVSIQTHPSFEMKSIRLMDITGKLIMNRPVVNSSFYQMELDQLTAGTYLVEIHFDKGRIIEKLVLK